MRFKSKERFVGFFQISWRAITDGFNFLKVEAKNV
jgi:hypothetical protein